MKIFIHLLILSICVGPLLLNAQIKIPQALNKQLEGKTRFTEIKNTVLQYYTVANSKLTRGDSVSKKNNNRQLKFWNRFFEESEGRLDEKGNIVNASLQISNLQKSTSTINNNIKAYPNPIKDILNIESINAEIQKIELYDLQGRLILTENVKTYKYQLNLSQLQTTTYNLSTIDEIS